MQCRLLRYIYQREEYKVLHGGRLTLKDLHERAPVSSGPAGPSKGQVLSVGIPALAGKEEMCACLPSMQTAHVCFVHHY